MYANLGGFKIHSLCPLLSLLPVDINILFPVFNILADNSIRSFFHSFVHQS